MPFSCVQAQEIPADKKDIFSVSGLPLPRFVSLENSVTNARSGPGTQYPIKWVYAKKGLPVEVVLEYDHWRKVRDHEGDESWVYKTLLSGERTAIVKGHDLVIAYDRNPSENSQKAKPCMKVKPMSLVHVTSCNDSFCEISISKLYGWIKRKSLWGVYEHENFD